MALWHCGSTQCGNTQCGSTWQNNLSDMAATPHLHLGGPFTEIHENIALKILVIFHTPSLPDVLFTDALTRPRRQNPMKTFKFQFTLKPPHLNEHLTTMKLEIEIQNNVLFREYILGW